MPAGERRNLMLGGAALLLLGLAAYLYFSRSGVKADFPREYTVDGMCLACQTPARVSAPLAEHEPLVCPACEARAVYGWWYCYDCNKQFIPNLVPSADGGPPRLPVVPVCTGCRSARTGAFISDDPEQEPLGKVALPKWP